jgi:hypothetical protein
MASYKQYKQQKEAEAAASEAHEDGAEASEYPMKSKGTMGKRSYSNDVANLLLLLSSIIITRIVIQIFYRFLL